MDGSVELLASYFTLAGGETPRVAHHVSPIDLRLRAEAAARAGFTGMGLWHADLEQILQRDSLTEIRRILDDNGIVHVEVEFLTDWYAEGEARRRSDGTRRLLLEAAAALGAHHIKVGDLLRTPCPMPALIEGFARLCEEAARAGTRIGYEMMPFCIIDSLDSALALVNGADQPNGGICFDMWHIAKLDIPFAAVAAVPPARITSIELNDGFARSMPDLSVETTEHRQLCGEGDWDVAGFVRAMRQAGFTGPWGVEILNSRLRALPVEEMARRAYRTTMAMFA